jgi:6-phosphogluconolactonase
LIEASQIQEEKMKVMKSVMFAALVCGLVMLCSTGAWAQRPQFVYVNDDPAFAPNTIQGYSVNTTTGVLTELAGSPYSTCVSCSNNLGGGGGYYASSKATIRAIHPGTSTNCLYVTNGGSDTFSIMNLNAETGIPSAKILGPFTDGGSSAGLGMAAATSPNGKFLFIANGGSNNISAYKIGTHCEVTNIPGSPFSTADGGSPDGIIVTGDSKFVFVAEPSNLSITSYTIGANGALSAGSTTAAAGSAAGIDEDCVSGNIYVADASFNVTVEGYSRSGATLSPLPGTPYNFFFSSSNSNGVLVDGTGTDVFVTNQTGATVTSLKIAADGSLTNNTGSPFPDGNSSSDSPSSLSISPSGKNLFTGDFNINFFGAGVGSLLNNAGTLTQAPGSPFVTATNSAPLSVVAFPTKRVCAK